MVVRLTANGWILGALLVSIIGVACDRGRYGLEEDIGHGASALSASEGPGASAWDEPQGDASVGDVGVSAVDGGADCEGVPACVSPAQSAFAKGDPIRIFWKNTEAGATRLGVFLDRGSPFEFVASTSVGAGAGTFVVNALPVGEYLVRLTDESYQVYGASRVFSVFERLSASRSLYYSPRDYITVVWRDCDNEPGDWVALAPEGSSDATDTMWVPTAGRDGAHAFGPLPAGTYRARYYSQGARGKTQESEPVTVPGLFSPRFQSISAGASVGCGVTPHGRVRCWGSTGGVGGLLPNMDEQGPAAVVQGLSDAIQVSTGLSRACALLTDRTVRCWGVYYSDVRGSGGPEASWMPIASPFTVEGLVDAVAISVGGERMCALLGDGTIRCGVKSAQAVEGISQAISVDVGEKHACAVLRDRTVRCWGDNRDGQVGDPNATGEDHPPYAVAGVTDVVQVKAGRAHTCALLRGGSVQCWGRNSNGQLGNGTFSESSVPVTVTGMVDVVAVSVGEYHSCGLTKQGKVRCWGSNSETQLGNGRMGSSAVPVEVLGLPHAAAVSAGAQHTCALLKDGKALCWGSSYGALADGTSDTTSEIDGLGGTLSLSAGADHVCAVTRHGRVLCWGTYDLNEVPAGGYHTYRTNLPTEVRDIRGAVSVSAGGEHSCAVVCDGTVRCWGAVGFSQSREEYPPTLTAIPIPGLAGAAAKVSAGWDVTCVVLRDGRVSCWGENEYGQRGDGTTGAAPLPTLVSGVTDAVDVSVRWDHVCAVLRDGTLRCWGSNEYGQLGNGSVATATSVPVPVLGIGNAVGVGTSREGTCALLKDGTVWCWGDGSVVPEQVMGVADATALSTGAAHSCARLADGRVTCWGSNAGGQLGTGSMLEQAEPVQFGAVKDALLLATGSSFTCVLHSHSRIRCWGYGDYGQFGNGKVPWVLWPSPVLGLVQ